MTLLTIIFCFNRCTSNVTFATIITTTITNTTNVMFIGTTAAVVCAEPHRIHLISCAILQCTF